jgi:hypothetical protein
MHKSKFVELTLLIVATVLAFLCLRMVAGERIDLSDLAKGAENTSSRESYQDKIFTAHNISDIETLVSERSSKKRNVSADPKGLLWILWLGNSQLHYINQYKEGDHLAPYWLRLQSNSPDNFEPLALSLPNASLQEFFILSQYITSNVKIKGLIMELVFDDLREDNIRNEFSKILSPDLTDLIRKSSSIGATIIDKVFPPDKGTGDNRDILAGTIQQPVEKWLTEQMNKHWRLWAERPQIEGDLLVGLYYFRNWIFGIKPTSERKMIRARYDLNMQALRELLKDYQRRDIRVVLYIAPIRQDHPIPYNKHEYARWKSELEVLAQEFGAKLANFENLVPNDQWGSYHKDDLDFMHFQGSGHRMVAQALLPYIKPLMNNGK